MFPQQPGFGMDQRHCVLQLIAEAESAAALIVSAARPKTARKRLVEQPAVGQHIERRVRRFHIDRSQRMFPVLPHSFERRMCRLGEAEAIGQMPCLLRTGPRAKGEDHLTLFSRRQIELSLHRGAWVQARASLSGQPRTGHRSRGAQCAVASQKFPTVARHRSRHLAGGEERHPSGERDVVGIAREDRAAGGFILRHDVHRRFRRQIAQHPFDVAGRGKFARAVGIVADLHHRELHRRIRGHIDPGLRVNSALAVFEHAVAESVPAHVRFRASPRHGRGRPEVPRLFIAQIICLATGVAHRIVAPRSQPELVRVFRPGISQCRPRKPRFRNSRSPARSPMARALPAAASW